MTRGISTPRLIVANLDAEREFGAQRTPLPRRVRTHVAALSTLLRVFARPGDRLWTIAEVDPRRVTDALDLPRPVLESGPLRPPTADPSILPWAVTPALHRLRIAAASPLSGLDPRHTEHLSQRIWTCPWPDAEVVRRICDRAFQLDLAQQLGVALPEAEVLTSMHDLDKHLAATQCARWVLKAPFSAAGRDRVIGQGRRIEASSRRQATQLLERFTHLVFEPWLERLADFSCCVFIESNHVDCVGIQQLEVNSTGGFSGIVVARNEGELLTARECEQLRTCAQRIGQALCASGFSGPLGIDAWRYRKPDGTTVIHPLGEINPRLTFGWIARSLAERVWPSHPATQRVRLRLGRGTEAPQPGSDSIELLASSSTDLGAAWLEIDPSYAHQSLSNGPSVTQ